MVTHSLASKPSYRPGFGCFWSDVQVCHQRHSSASDLLAFVQNGEGRLGLFCHANNVNICFGRQVGGGGGVSEQSNTIMCCLS